MPVADAALSALLEEAAGLRRQGALSAAAERYRQVFERDPRNVEALYQGAQLSCQQGDLAGGIALLRRALAVDAGQGRLHNLLGMALCALGQPQEAVVSFDAAIVLQPTLAAAHGGRGDALATLGRLGDAVASYDSALALQPGSIESWCNRGAALQDLGRHEEALASYRHVLTLQPDFPEMHLNVANVLMHSGRFEEAVSHCDQALALKADFVQALVVRGNGLRALRRSQEALASYDKACVLDPRLVPGLVNRALALRDVGRPADALASIDAALAIDAQDPQTWSHRGTALYELGRHAEALESYDRSLALGLDESNTHFHRGISLYALNRNEEALAAFDRALQLDPHDAEALTNRGSTLLRLRRDEEALASYDAASSIVRDHPEANIGRGTVLLNRGRPEEAVACFDRALATRPDDVTALVNRSLALMKLGRRDEAIACQQRVLALDPGNDNAYSSLLFGYLATCDWANLDALTADLPSRLDRGAAPEPFAILEFSGDPAQQLRSARNYARARFAGISGLSLPATARTQEKRIRIAYVSADFRAHPVAYAISKLLESHDRSRFEVIGISYGPDDESEVRARLVRTFNQFHNVSATSDADAAALLHGSGVDIAVDLMGYTERARPGILARRPAPVQVNYLGYSATTGADFIDYVIADRVVLPPSAEQDVSEQVVRLPDCFLANEGPKRLISKLPTRAEAGLPEQGLVFCCFNNSWKIRREIFDIWMRLLRRVEGSVLWLARTDEVGMATLRREAAARDVAPDRIIFAPKVPQLADHLARHRVADLFLDTLPYNAHSTASDALWTGLPVLTCMGQTFTGRIAASVLINAGLPELVTHSLAEYEALALSLATDPAALRAVRSKLDGSRAGSPLFDMERLRRHIEAAYLTMWDRNRRGEPVRGFDVVPIEVGGSP
jgi:protein O-GlcNAc transferase